MLTAFGLHARSLHQMLRNQSAGYAVSAKPADFSDSKIRKTFLSIGLSSDLARIFSGGRRSKPLMKPRRPAVCRNIRKRQLINAPPLPMQRGCVFSHDLPVCSTGKLQLGHDMQQAPLLLRQIGDQLDIADCQRKLELVFQPCFLQHVRHMKFHS